VLYVLPPRTCQICGAEFRTMVPTHTRCALCFSRVELYYWQYLTRAAQGPTTVAPINGAGLSVATTPH
jgi:hypothetical protein